MSCLAQWSPAYETGNVKIDDQHRHLFEIINSLDYSLKQKISEQEIREILNDLFHYTQIHFHDEEELMKAMNYPYQVEHKTIHDHLIQEVKALQYRLTQEENVFSLYLDLTSFLSDWLAHHIQEKDKGMIDYMRQHPVSHSGTRDLITGVWGSESGS